MIALSALGAAVEVEMVASLMTARPPELLLDADQDGNAVSPLFVASVRGVCTEVQPYLGAAISGPRWDLATWAVTLGVAAQLEASLFPEQQGLGDSSRASILERRYQAALTQLAGRLPGDLGDEATGQRPTAPTGSFPPAPQCYPDPAERARTPYVLPGGW